MTTAPTATDEAADPTADEAAAWAASLRASSRAAALDAHQYAVARAEVAIGASGPQFDAHRDAHLFAWVDGFLLADAGTDRPEGIVARTLGVADAFAELRAAGAL